MAIESDVYAIDSSNSTIDTHEVMNGDRLGRNNVACADKQSMGSVTQAIV